MEIKFIKGNKTFLGAYNEKVHKLRVAAYCRVSTDEDDQIKSYNSMIKYYTDLIQKNDEWEFVGIYADRGITGTNVKKREDFQRLIEDCINGKIDMIITKSIPRFARNTLDTLKYVRMLKEKNIAIYFEVEKINTLKDGEFLMTILSSVAQQEVENTSAYVKKGLKMKMKRGELVGFNRCFGYEVDNETGELKIVEEEALAVRYIFNRYLQGVGGRVIARELNERGIFTVRNCKWTGPTIIEIIKNEKYKGDLLQGKTFTVDPISKRRLPNRGEEDKYYVVGHHEPIVSKEVFDKAQELRKAKNTKVTSRNTGENRTRVKRQYAFSYMIKCGYCGKNLSRRTWHSSSVYSRVIWQCSKASKEGKRFCPKSKGIPEDILEEAFVESYNKLCDNNQDVLEDFLKRIKVILKDENNEDIINQINAKIQKIKTKRNKLVDSYLDGIIPKDIYEKKERLLKNTLSKEQNELKYFKKQINSESSISDRIEEFRKSLTGNPVLKEFDRFVFESIVEKVIVGGFDENGNEDPYKITFVYKTGIKHEIKEAKKNLMTKVYRPKKEDTKMYSFNSNDPAAVCSNVSDNRNK